MGMKIKNAVGALKQYTKRILTAIVIIWAVGGFIGIAYEFVRLAVCPESASMDGLYVYLAAPITCGLPSYIIPNLFLKRSELQTGRYYGEEITETIEPHEGEGK